MDAPGPVAACSDRDHTTLGKALGDGTPGGLAAKRRMLELEGAPGYAQQELFG